MKKFRDEYGAFVVEGDKVVKDVIEAGMVVRSVYGTLEWMKDNFGFVAEFSAKNVRFITVTDKELERISNFDSPNGVLCVVDKIDESLTGFDPKNELVLMLDSINDPGNMGTIIRTACWFGIKTIICSNGCVDIYNPKVVQATMGAIARIGFKYADLNAVLSEMDANIKVYGTLLDGENIYEKTLRREKGILIMGSESHGVSDEVRKFITVGLFIPFYGLNQPGYPESLNVSVATGVVLSEFAK